MLVSTVAELIAAVGNSAIGKILVAAGTYDFTTDMCTTDHIDSAYRGYYDYDRWQSGADAWTDGAAICINRTVTIEAQVPGSVVLNAGSVVRQPLDTQHPSGDEVLEPGVRVIEVESGGMARLIGLNITGGHASVRSVALLNTYIALDLTLELTGCCARAHCLVSQYVSARL